MAGKESATRIPKIYFLIILYSLKPLIIHA